MKYFTATFLLISLFSCNKTVQETGSENPLVELDTVFYTDRYVQTEEDQKKNPVILINTVPPDEQLIIGKTDTMTIKIHRMENYPAVIKNTINCKLTRLDNEYFSFTPDSVNCSFEVWQDYDSGKVISQLKTSFEDSIRVTYKMLEGEHIVGKVNMSKYVANRR